MLVLSVLKISAWKLHFVFGLCILMLGEVLTLKVLYSSTIYLIFLWVHSTKLLLMCLNIIFIYFKIFFCVPFCAPRKILPAFPDQLWPDILWVNKFQDLKHSCLATKSEARVYGQQTHLNRRSAENSKPQ